MVGDLYPEGGARRDAGFSVFYMGINLGAFLGPLICGYFAENIDWHYGFGIAGIGMVIGLIQYRLSGSSLGEIGMVPKAKQGEEDAPASSSGKNLALILAALFIGVLLILQFTGQIDLLTAEGLAQAMGLIIIAIVATYFIYLFIAGNLTALEKKKTWVIIILFVGAAVFWSGFEQAGSSLNLFAKYFTDRNFGGWEMPASWLQSVNSFFIITLAPLFGMLWIRLSKRNLEPSSPMKFALGLIQLGLGFFVMVAAANVVANGIANGAQASPFFLILTYFLHTTGELCLSPVGLSTTTKLAPKKYVGQMMGIWFVGTALGNLIAGLAAGRFDFSLFDKTDKALGLVNGADAITPELLAKIDQNVLQSIDQELIKSNDLEGIKAALSNLLNTVSTESIPQMPDLFFSIFLITAGAGVILLAFSRPVRKWMGDVH